MPPASREPLTVAAHDYLITLFMFLIELLSENQGERKVGGVALPERVLDLWSGSVDNLGVNTLEHEANEKSWR